MLLSIIYQEINATLNFVIKLEFNKTAELSPIETIKVFNYPMLKSPKFRVHHKKEKMV